MLLLSACFSCRNSNATGKLMFLSFPIAALNLFIVLILDYYWEERVDFHTPTPHTHIFNSSMASYSIQVMFFQERVAVLTHEMPRMSYIASLHSLPSEYIIIYQNSSMLFITITFHRITLYVLYWIMKRHCTFVSKLCTRISFLKPLPPVEKHVITHIC